MKKPTSKNLAVPAVVFLLAAFFHPSAAQTPYQPAALTAEDYARGEQALSAHTSSLVFYDDVRPNWMDWSSDVYFVPRFL